MTAPGNFYMHAYPDLDKQQLFLNGYCVAIHNPADGDVLSIIGPFPTEDDAGLLAMQMAREAPDRNFHLWPMVGLTEMRNPK